MNREGGTRYVATPVRISCIKVSDRFNPWERIISIGGDGADGSRWKMSHEQAIADIEAGKWSFFVERPTGDRVAVIVAMSADGNKYLKSVADGVQPDILLSLPE